MRFLLESIASGMAINGQCSARNTSLEQAECSVYTGLEGTILPTIGCGKQAKSSEAAITPVNTCSQFKGKTYSTFLESMLIGVLF